MNNYYIVLSHSNTLMARLVRVFTGAYWNHTSLALSGELNEFYSFGRKNPRLLFPAGFISEGVHTGYFGYKPKTKIAVYQAQMTDEEYSKMLKQLDKFRHRRDEYHYNILGLPATYANIPWGRRRHYTCSGFVAYCMQDVLEFDKHYSLVRPEDFMIFDFEKIYEGAAGDYNYEKQQLQY